jgi:hypothetical protein
MKTYSATNMSSNKGSFLDERGIEENWDTMGGIMGYCNGFGRCDADGNDLYSVLEGEASAELDSIELENYGLKAIRWIWDILKVKPTKDFDSFVDQIFFDTVVNQQFKHEDLPEFGKMVAMYLLDHPYPNINKLKANFEQFAKTIPTNKIPTRWALSQVVVKTASETGFSQLAKLTVTATKEMFKDVSKVAVTGAKFALAYKIAGVALAGLVLMNTLMGKKRA